LTQPTEVTDTFKSGSPDDDCSTRQSLELDGRTAPPPVRSVDIGIHLPKGDPDFCSHPCAFRALRCRGSVADRSLSASILKIFLLAILLLALSDGEADVNNHLSTTLQEACGECTGKWTQNTKRSPKLEANMWQNTTFDNWLSLDTGPLYLDTRHPLNLVH
jgi:hypothetical protein